MLPNSVNTLAGFSPAARIIPAMSGKSVPISPNAPESSLRSKRMRGSRLGRASDGGDVMVTFILQRSFCRIEAYEHRFGLQLDAEPILDAGLNVIFQSDDLRRSRAPAVNDGQRMLAADADRAARVTAMKSGVLNQPRGGNFQLSFSASELRHALAMRCAAEVDALALLRCHHGILEKRTGAATIRVALFDQHGLASPDAAHRRASFRQGRRSSSARKEFLQIGIFDARRCARRQAKRDSQHNVAPARRRIEDAGTVGEAGIAIFNLANLPLLQIKHPHAGDGFRNLLAVSAHVLYWSSAHSAWNSAHALDPAAIALDCVGDKPVPTFARACAEKSGAILRGLRDAADADLQHRAGETRIRNH